MKKTASTVPSRSELINIIKTDADPVKRLKAFQLLIENDPQAFIDNFSLIYELNKEENQSIIKDVLETFVGNLTPQVQPILGAFIAFRKVPRANIDTILNFAQKIFDENAKLITNPPQKRNEGKIAS